MNNNNLTLPVIFLLIISSSIFVFAERLYDVTFKYESFLPVESVSVAVHLIIGINHPTLMTDDDRDRIWKITKKLPPGKHHYKFVLNDSDWITDKNADEFVSDGFGGQNSVVVVGNFDYLKIPAKKGDNKIIEEALFFDTSIQYFNPVTKDKILFIIQTRADDITKSELILNPGSNSEKVIPLYFVSSNNGLDFYEAMPTINSREVTFLFKVQDGSKVLYLDSEEISKTKNPKNAFNVNLDKIEIFETPDWVKEAIVYQIFPERFYNGDVSNDPLQDKRRPEDKPGIFLTLI